MKRVFLAIAFTTLIGPAVSAWGDEEKGFYARAFPMDVKNPEKPTQDEFFVFTKSFCVAMRRFHNKTDKTDLRGFFDPRYLKKHQIADDELPVELAPVGSIYSYHVADDQRSVLCFVGTSNPGKPDANVESLLLRTTVYNGHLYLSPVNPPNEKTGMFTPWILRTKLDPNYLFER